MQVLGHLADVTFSDIAGVYDDRAKVIVLGTQGLTVREVVPHEFAHALCDLLGYNDDKRVVRAYEAAAPSLGGFYLDNGEASRRGCQEFLADAVRHAIIHGRAPTELGADFAHFIDEVVLKGLTGGE